MTIDHGIPGLFAVEQTIFRGGQPNKEGWIWLENEGVTDVIKLNTEEEGSDASAEALGLKVHRFPIPWWRQTILWPKQDDLMAAVMLMKGKVFVHCEHGEDRTGLVVGCFRLSQGWSKEEAFHEMIAFKFHTILQALLGRWNSERPEDWIKT